MLTRVPQDLPHPWCTPNPLPGAPVVNPAQDISVSATRYGSLVDNTGVFAAANRAVAEAKGVDQARIMVGGSSGAIRTIVWSLVSEYGSDAVVLVAGNAHRSVIHAAEQCGLRLRFLRADLFRSVLLPPTHDAVASTLAQLAAEGEQPVAVWLTSPTYEGLVADISGIGRIVHTTGAVLVVDEAWGPHAGVADGLLSAMQLGADIVTQSTHKLGGSLQQTALLTWNESRVCSDTMQMAIRQTSTTSPNYGLAASAEHAILTLHEAPELLQGPIGRVDELKALLKNAVPSIGFIEDLTAGFEGVSAVDPMRTTLDLAATGMSGRCIQEGVERHGIVVEKATGDTVTVLGLFRQRHDTAQVTARAIAGIITDGRPRPGATSDQSTATTCSTQSRVRRPVLELHEVARARDAIRVPVAGVVGSIASETVEVYPPGIPVLMPGYEIRQQDLDLLEETAAGGGRVVASDPTMSTIRVLRSSCDGSGAMPASRSAERVPTDDSRPKLLGLPGASAAVLP